MSKDNTRSWRLDTSHTSRQNRMWLSRPPSHSTPLESRSHGVSTKCVSSCVRVCVISKLNWGRMTSRGSRRNQ